MKKALSVMSIAVGLLALVSFPALTQTFQYGRAACDAGPGSFVTGDTVVINGLSYYAIVGTAGDDVLVGVDDLNFEGDLIWGLGGNDTISGGNGNDVLCGGDGADTVDGGPGYDMVQGGNGDNLLLGGPGTDRLQGGGGSDEMYGEDGDDDWDLTLPSGDRAGMYGGSGQDLMYGGNGDDSLVGQSDDDVEFGEDGADEVAGGPGYDIVDGGAGKFDACEAEKEKKCELVFMP